MEIDWIELEMEKAEEEYYDYVDLWEWMPKDYNPYLNEEGIDEWVEVEKLQEQIDKIEEELLRPLQKQMKFYDDRAKERARKKFEEMEEKRGIMIFPFFCL